LKITCTSLTLQRNREIIRHFDATEYCNYIDNVRLEALTAVAAATCPHWFFAHGFFYPEDGGDMFLRNVG
jgi:hypothetical protein